MVRPLNKNPLFKIILTRKIENDESEKSTIEICPYNYHYLGLYNLKVRRVLNNEYDDNIDHCGYRTRKGDVKKMFSNRDLILENKIESYGMATKLEFSYTDDSKKEKLFQAIENMLEVCCDPFNKEVETKRYSNHENVELKQYYDTAPGLKLFYAYDVY